MRTISGKVARLGGDFSGRTVNREGYLRNLDKVVFGQNPREGYFVGNTFISLSSASRSASPKGGRPATRDRRWGPSPPIRTPWWR